MAEEVAGESGALDDPRTRAVVDQIGQQVVELVRAEIATLTAAARDSSVALERRLHQVEESLAAEVERVRSSAKPVIDMLGGDLRSMVADTRNLAHVTSEVSDQLTEVIAVARSAADAAGAATGLQEQLEAISRSLRDRKDVDLAPLHQRIDQIAQSLAAAGSVDLGPVLDAVAASRPDLGALEARLDDLARKVDERGVDLGPLHGHLDALGTQQADHAAELREVVSDRSLSTAARLDAVAASVAQAVEGLAALGEAQLDQPDVGELVGRLANRIDDAAQLARNDQQALVERLGPVAEQVQALRADVAGRHAIEAVAARIEELHEDRHALAAALGSLTERLEAAVVEGNGAVVDRLDAIEARATDPAPVLDGLRELREAIRPLEQLSSLEAAVRELRERQPDLSGELAPLLQAIERVQDTNDRAAGRVDDLAATSATLGSLGPSIESALAALSTDVSGLVANDDAIRSALLRLHDESASTSTRLEEIAGAAFAVRSIGPDLHAGLAAIKAQVDDLTTRDEDARGELAALGPKLNELLERRPDWNQVLEPLAERLERHTGAVSQNHELLERVLALVVAMKDTVGLTAGIGDQVRDALAPVVSAHETSREDLSTAVESLAHLSTSTEAQRDAVAALSARYDEGLEAIRLAVSTPVGNLERLIALRADHTDSSIEALRPALAALEVVQEQLEQLDGVTAGMDRVRHVIDPLRDRVESVATAIEAIDVAGPISDATAELAEEIGARTTATAAGLARMLDDRLGAMTERVDERLAAAIAAVSELAPTITERLDAVQATVDSGDVGAIAAEVFALRNDLAAQPEALTAAIRSHLDRLEAPLDALRVAVEDQGGRSADLVAARLADLQAPLDELDRAIADQHAQAAAIIEPLESLRRELADQGERTQARLAEQDEQTAALVAQVQRPLEVLTRTPPITEPLTAIERAIAELADRTSGQLAQLAQTLDVMDQSLTEQTAPDVAAPIEALQQVLLGGLGDIRAAVRGIDDELASRLELADAGLASRLGELQAAVTGIERAMSQSSPSATDDVAAEVAGVRDAIRATEQSLEAAIVTRLDELTASVAAAQTVGAARADQAGASAADAVAELRDELTSIERTVAEQLSVLRAAITQSQQGIADHVGAQLTNLRTAIGDQSADPSRWRAELDRALDQLGGELMSAVSGLRAQIERGANDAGDLRTNLDAALERVASRLQSDVGKVMAAVSGSDELLQDRLRRVDAELTELRGVVESLVRRTSDNLPVLAGAEPPPRQIGD